MCENLLHFSSQAVIFSSSANVITYSFISDIKNHVILNVRLHKQRNKEWANAQLSGIAWGFCPPLTLSRPYLSLKYNLMPYSKCCRTFSGEATYSSSMKQWFQWFVLFYLSSNKCGSMKVDIFKNRFNNFSYNFVSS